MKDIMKRWLDEGYFPDTTWCVIDGELVRELTIDYNDVEIYYEYLKEEPTPEYIQEKINKHKNENNKH